MSVPTTKQPLTRLQLIRLGVDRINATRGRGEITGIKMFLNGYGEASRKFQISQPDTIGFWVTEKGDGRYQVKALGTTKIVDQSEESA